MIVLTNWFLASRDAKSNFNSTDAKSAPYKLAPNLPLLNRLVMSLRLIFQVECYKSHKTLALDTDIESERRDALLLIYIAHSTQNEKQRRLLSSVGALWGNK